jgi:hypothetical protein
MTNLTVAFRNFANAPQISRMSNASLITALLSMYTHTPGLLPCSDVSIKSDYHRMRTECKYSPPKWLNITPDCYVSPHQTSTPQYDSVCSVPSITALHIVSAMTEEYRKYELPSLFVSVCYMSDMELCRFLRRLYPTFLLKKKQVLELDLCSRPWFKFSTT